MTSGYKIVFVGLNVATALEQLCKQKITLKDVKRQAKRCEITVSLQQAPLVVDFLQKKCYNIEGTNYVGVCKILHLKQHLALVVAFALLVPLLWASSCFCLGVEVSGDFSKDQVLLALQNCNVFVGANISNVDWNAVQNSVANQLDAMYAIVKPRGSVLYVNVVQRQISDPVVDLTKRRDIVAPCNGVVQSLLCQQGTPQVKVGDAVKQGDVLVLGVRTFNDGTTEDVFALGNVQLAVSQSAFQEFCGTQTVFVPTGNSATCVNVVLFGKTYGKQPNYTNYQQQISVVRLFPLNLQLQYVTYHQTTQITREVQLADVLPTLQNQALQEATKLATFPVQRVEYQQLPNGVVATVFGVVEVW